MRRHQVRGFTLIELLVVLAIVAVIAALLFPVFAQAREKARQTACLSHMRQVAMALYLYTEDYDETFLWNPPPGRQPGAWTADWLRGEAGRKMECLNQPSVSFVVLLQPYLRSEGVFRCPSYPGHPLRLFNQYAASLDPERHSGIGFGVNQLLIGDPCRPRTIASLRHSTSEVALMGEAQGPWSGMNNWIDWLRNPMVDVHWGWEKVEVLDGDSFWKPWNDSRHIEGSNFAFADGHAKYLRPGGISVDTDPQRPPYKAILHHGHFPKALLE
jgi:prepilin-type N-terminal cleavage/methylation domain-containing protein/prepilin-type processing-associated H-X9-DG protein